MNECIHKSRLESLVHCEYGYINEIFHLFLILIKQSRSHTFGFECWMKNVINSSEVLVFFPLKNFDKEELDLKVFV